MTSVFLNLFLTLLLVYAIFGCYLIIYRTKNIFHVRVLAVILCLCFIGFAISHTLASYVVCIILAYLLRKLYHRSLNIQRETLNKDANNLYGKYISNGNNTLDFALYLRPFNSKGLVKKRNLLARLNPLDFRNYIHTNNWITLEENLNTTMKKLGHPFICIDNPKETLNIGSILMSESNWRNKVSPLIQDAKMILMLPSQQTGTLWEFEKILHDGLIEKTLFILPGLNRRNSYRLSWNETCKTFLNKFEISLPSYEKKLVFFTISKNRKVTVIGKSKYLFRKKIQEIISEYWISLALKNRFKVKCTTNPTSQV